MKKKLILPIVLATSMIITPLTTQANFVKELAEFAGIAGDLSSMAKDTSEFILKGVGLRDTAASVEDFHDALEVLLEEMNKDKPDFTKILDVAAETNRIALGVMGDLKKVLDKITMPVKLLLPKKKVTIGKNEFFLDEVPGFFNKLIVDALSLQYKVTAKALDMIVKTKKTIIPGTALDDAAAAGVAQEAAGPKEGDAAKEAAGPKEGDAAKEAARPERRIIEMD